MTDVPISLCAVAVQVLNTSDLVCKAKLTPSNGRMEEFQIQAGLITAVCGAGEVLVILAVAEMAGA